MVTKNPKMNALLKGVLFGVLLFGGLYFNIFAHEVGHYLVADNLQLNPKLHLFDNGAGTGFSFANQKHYVEYQSPDTDLGADDFEIALAGPLVNILLSVILLVAYTRVPKEKRTLKLALVMLIIPSVLSALANLMPTPGTDGATVWSYLT